MVSDQKKLKYARNGRSPKIPITLEEYRKIRKYIRHEGGRFASRNLLLINLHTNTAVSASDVLKFKTGTVFRQGKILSKFWINQKKINKSQLVSATRSIRSDLESVIQDYTTRFGPDYFRNPKNPLFPSQQSIREDGHYKALSYSAYRGLLRRIFIALGFDPERYGTHSLRSALPQAYFLRTGDVKGANALYEHTSGSTTITYVEKKSLRKAIEIRKDCQFID